MFNMDPPERVELTLLLPGSRIWTLTVSSGVERFIGHYPRVAGIDAGAGLLEYRAVKAR